MADWLPKGLKHDYDRKANSRQLNDGEPTIHPLDRWVDDNFLSTYQVNSCCDCGLKHLHHYVIQRKGKKCPRRLCVTCGSKGFEPSILGEDRCTFCDGTEGGAGPKPDPQYEEWRYAVFEQECE